MKTAVVLFLMTSLYANADITSEIVRLGPRPPVERFPDKPYVAPPTPQDRAEAQAEREARATLLARRDAAIAAIVANAEIDTAGMNAIEAAEVEALALEAIANVVTDGGSTSAGVAIGLALGAAIGAGAGAAVAKKGG